MTDVVDLGTIVLQKEEIKKYKDKVGGFLDGVFGKKSKVVENEDGTIARELKVGKQKLSMTTVKLGEDKFVVNEIAELDDKNVKKLMEKDGKGKKLSDDEKFWLNFKDRTAVGMAMIDSGVLAMDAAMVTAYSKDEIAGKSAVGDYSLNLDGYTGDKTALLNNLKKRMIDAYGAEFGEKRFEDLVSRSNLAAEVTKLEDKEKISTEEKKVEEQTPVKAESVKVVEPTMADEKARENVKATMKADVTKVSQPIVTETVKVSAKEDMKADEKVAKIRDLMNRPGVKMQDKDAALDKLVENFGAEAAYQIVYKSITEPLHAMKAMDEGFKRSGASIEYFTTIDPNDAEKMAKVAELTGVVVENMPAGKKRASERIAGDVEKVSLHNALKLDIKTVADIDPKDIKIPSQAEVQYNNMLADKEILKLGELLDYGVTLNDLQVTLKDMMNHENNKDRQEELIPDGMPNRETEVSKEFATALIEKVQNRQHLAYLQKNGKGR